MAARSRRRPWRPSRSAIDRETRRFDWRVGDVLILDNMLAQHGREPFRGPRRILTIMSTPYSSLAPADVPPTPSRLALRRCRMSASFSAPRLRPRQLSAGDLWRKACSTRPTTTCASSARASRAWTCGNGSPPPAQGCATACCGMAASLFRGFAVRRSGGLSQAVQSFSPNMLDYLRARGGTPGSGAPGVHLHRVLAGRLDSAAPRDVLLHNWPSYYPLLPPDAARHPGPHAPGRRAPGQRSDTRGDQAALPPPWGVLRCATTGRRST